MKQEINNNKKTLFNKGGIFIIKYISKNITNNDYIYSSEVPITTGDLPPMMKDERVIGREGRGKHRGMLKWIYSLGFFYY